MLAKICSLTATLNKSLQLPSFTCATLYKLGTSGVTVILETSPAFASSSLNYCNSLFSLFLIVHHLLWSVIKMTANLCDDAMHRAGSDAALGPGCWRTHSGARLYSPFAHLSSIYMPLLHVSNFVCSVSNRSLSVSIWP